MMILRPGKWKQLVMVLTSSALSTRLVLEKRHSLKLVKSQSSNSLESWRVEKFRRYKWECELWLVLLLRDRSKASGVENG